MVGDPSVCGTHRLGLAGQAGNGTPAEEVKSPHGTDWFHILSVASLCFGWHKIFSQKTHAVRICHRWLIIKGINEKM